MYEQARKYITGNAILYKRNDSNERRGPCIVLVKSTNKCLPSTAVSILEYTPVDYNL